MDVFNKIHILCLYSCIKRALLHLLFFVCECVCAADSLLFSFLSLLLEKRKNLKQRKNKNKCWNIQIEWYSIQHTRAPNNLKITGCRFTRSFARLLICLFVFLLFSFQQQNNKIVGNIIIDMLGPRYLYIFQNEWAMPMCMCVCAVQRTQSN